MANDTTATADARDDAATSHQFQAEVAKLLHLMVHSVYSDRDVFLRELISNAADALDKLRYEAIAQPELLEGAARPQDHHHARQGRRRRSPSPTPASA